MLTAVYFTAAILHGVLPVLVVWLSRFLINDIVFATGGATDTQVPLWLGLLFVITLLDAIALLVGTRYIPKRLEDELVVNITTLIMEHANRLPLKLFEDLAFQDTLERAQQQMALNFISFLRGIVEATIGFLQIGLLVLLIASIEPMMILVIILALPPYSAIMWIVSRRRYTAEFERASARRWIRYFTELLLQRAKAIEVRLLGIGGFIIEKFQSVLRDFATENAQIEKRATLASVIFVSVTLVAFYYLFYNITQRVIAGSLTVGDVAIVVGAIGRLSIVAEQVVSKLGLALERSLYVANLKTYLAIPTETPTDSASDTPMALNPPIEFRNVSFRYPSREDNVLTDVSFTIQAGETVAIVGENGAGKSTLVKLLAKIYDPQTGDIFIGGQALRDIPPDSIRQQVSFILQNFTRYEATVADNIAYGNIREYLDKPEKTQPLAETLGIADFIEAMPEGYDTFVGRRFGKYDVSGGQWQQLAIARAFTRNTPFLILDEPTASLDAEIEHRIFSRLATLTAHQTTLLISHRFTTVSMADRIIVLSRGRIAEQGTHDALMQIPDGIYAQLYKLNREPF